MTTKKDFSKIQSTILVVLAIAALFQGALHFSSIDLPYKSSFEAFLVPAILLFGLIWFIVDITGYIKSESYLSNTLRIRNIGGLMGLTWFILIEVALIIILTINYDGSCRPSIMGDTIIACSIFSFLFQDAMTAIVFYISLMWFIPVPIIMYLIGFFVDRYTSKKIESSRVAN